MISEGQIIKVGRIKLKIKYIVTQKAKVDTKNQSKHNYKKLKQNSQYDFESKSDINYAPQKTTK